MPRRVKREAVKSRRPSSQSPEGKILGQRSKQMKVQGIETLLLPHDLG